MADNYTDPYEGLETGGMSVDPMSDPDVARAQYAPDPDDIDVPSAEQLSAEFDAERSWAAQGGGGAPPAVPFYRAGVQPPPSVQAAVPTATGAQPREIAAVSNQMDTLAQVAGQPKPQPRPAPDPSQQYYAAQPTATPAARGPARPQLPPQFAGEFGGRYYGPDEHAWLSDLASAKIKGEITPQQYDESRKRFEEYKGSIPGMATDIARREFEGVQQQGQLAMAGQETQSLAHLAAARVRDDHAAQERKRFAMAQERRKRMMADYQQRVERYDRANEAISREQVDPERFWNSKSTGSKIASAIFLGLGSAAAIGGGGPNHALGILNSQIDRDIDAQKHNIANKRAGLGAQQNVLAMMMQHYDTVEQAETAAKLFGLQQVDSKLKTIEQTTNSLLTRNKARQMRAGLQASIDTFEKKRRLEAKIAAVQEEQARAQQRAADAQRRHRLEMARMQQQALDEGGVVWAPESDADRKTYSRALGGYVRDLTEAKELESRIYVAEDMQDIARRMLERRGDNNAMLSPRQEALQNADARRLHLMTKEQYKAGALDAGMQEIAEQIVPVDFSVLGTDTMLLEALVSGAQSDIRKIRSRAPVDPGIRRTVVDPDTGRAVMMRGHMKTDQGRARGEHDAARGARGTDPARASRVQSQFKLSE